MVEIFRANLQKSSDKFGNKTVGRAAVPAMDASRQEVAPPTGEMAGTAARPTVRKQVTKSEAPILRLNMQASNQKCLKFFAPTFSGEKPQ